MSKQHPFVLELTPNITMEVGKDPKNGPNRREEAKRYPASTQYFAGRPYENNIINITGSERRKHRLGIFIGPSPQFCDIVVPDSDNSEHESPAWGLITFDCKNRLVYRDVRHPTENQDKTRSCKGSGITMGSELGAKDTRRGFTWVLFGSSFLSSTHPKISIRLTDHIQLTAVVSDCGLYSPEHAARVKAFLEAPVVYEMGDPATAEFEKALCLGQGLCLQPKGAKTKMLLVPHCSHSEQLDITLKIYAGAGSFGQVWRHYNVSTGESIAVKKPISAAGYDNLQAEIALFEKLEKVFVFFLSFFFSFFHTLLIPIAVRDNRQKGPDYSRFIVKFISGEMVPEPMLQLEYASHGTLEKQNNDRKLSMLEIIDALEQLLKAVSFLHRNGIAHRDIKPANVLVKYRAPRYLHRGNIGIRLADLGLAKFKIHTTAGLGTFVYMAPELFRNDASYTKAVDIWATGVMFYGIYYGLPPAIKTIQTTTAEAAFRPVGLQMCNDIHNTIAETARLGGRHAILVCFLHNYMVQLDAGQRLSADGCISELASLVQECGPDDLQTPGPRSPSRALESHIADHGSHALQSMSSFASASTSASMPTGSGPLSLSNAVAYVGCSHCLAACNNLSRGSNSSSISMPRTMAGFVPQTTRTSELYAPVVLDVNEDDDYDMAGTDDNLSVTGGDEFVIVDGNVA